MTRRQIPDAQIADAASQFVVAFDLLDKQPIGAGVLLPLLNCGAIAVELYLKALASHRVYTPDQFGCGSIVTARADSAGHELEALFNAVSDDLRDRLSGAFSAQFGEDFASVLIRIEGVFSKSRYSFERGNRLPENAIRDTSVLVQFLHGFVRAMPTTETITA